MQTETISLKEAQKLCRDRKASGKWFGVDVVKRTDGSLRHVVARGGVTKHLKGGELQFDPAKKRVLGVYDARAKGYRFINMDGIVEVRTTGHRYIVR
jgi:hypothetical protein